MKVFLLILLFNIKFCYTNANDFSSFLSANASLAIVIDEEFTRKRGEDIFTQVQNAVDDIVRKNIENGGVNVRYYTWGYVRLKKDFVAAVTVTDCKKTWKFFEMTEANSILLLAITEANCPRLPIHQAVMIPVIAKGDEVPQLLLDIKLQSVLNWKSCVLLFDGSVDDDSTQIVSSLTYSSPKSLFNSIALNLFRIDGKLGKQQRRNAIKNAVFKFKFLRGTKFIVFTELYEEVIDVATSLDMFNVFNQWLFFFPTNADINKIYSYTERLNEGANIAYAINNTVSECQENIFCSVTEVIFGFVTGLSKIIEQESALYGQISDEEWEAIRLTKKERQVEILTHLRHHLNFKSKCSGCSKWILRSMESWGKTGQYEQNPEHFEDSQTSRYIFTEVGHWNPMSGFITRDVLFPHIDHKFRNISLNFLTFNNQPWQNIITNEKGEVIEATGFVMEILKELSLRLNFTYFLHNMNLEGDEARRNMTHPDYLGSTTNLLSPKLIETMNDKKFFMIFGALTVDDNDGRMPFNFTVPISIQRYTFVSRRPGEVSRIYLFTAPFQVTTWVCLMIGILITTPSLYLINKYAAITSLRISGLDKIENCFWYIYGALLQQGGMYLPKADSGRVVVSIWWVVVIVLVTTYCGNLVAFLTFPKFEATNDYLSDIFRHNEIVTFGVRNGSYFAKQAKHSTRSDFVRYMEKATLYSDSNEEDLEAILKGKRVNIDWRINLQLRMQKDFDKHKMCNFIMGKEQFMDEKISLILPPKSPYLELINDEITRLQKVGFLQKWQKKYFPITDRCSTGLQSRQIVNHMVDIKDMQGCFLVLLLGFIFALFIICMEFLIYHFKKSRAQKKFIE